MNSLGHIEPWVNLEDFANHLGCKKRWLNYRVADGMPSAMIAGKRQVKITKAESWLIKEGHIVRSEAA